MRCLRLAWCSLLLIHACGCGESGPERTIVAGSVSFRGQPVEDGMIRFVPLERGAGPMAGSLIKNGKYEVVALGGVPVGRCRVEIKSRKPTSGGTTPDLPENLKAVSSPAAQTIPAKYNKESTLEVVIEPQDRVVHDFHLD